jgi:hypothetical protein
MRSGGEKGVKTYEMRARLDTALIKNILEFRLIGGRQKLAQERTSDEIVQMLVWEHSQSSRHPQ